MTGFDGLESEPGPQGSGLPGNRWKKVSDNAHPKMTLETSAGVIELELWPDKAPNHVANMLALAEDGFYDGRIFHRVIPGFMIQGGCPEGSGRGGPGYQIAAEFNDAPFAKGVLGMARSQSPDSAGSQFFVCVADAPHLTGQYTAFGCVLSGQDVADAIADKPRDRGDRPLDEVLLMSAKATLPEGYTRPDVKKI